MGNIRLYGSTSGYTELAPPAVAPDGVLALPSGTGTIATQAYVDTAETDAINTAIAGGGLVHINTTTLSGSSVSIDNCFSATYQNYRVVVNPDTSGDVQLRIRMRVGATDATGASDYTRQLFSSSNTTNAGARNTTSYWHIIDSNGVSSKNSFSFDIYKPFDTQVTTYNLTGLNGDVNSVLIVSAGMHLQSTSYDGFSIFPASGTITGTIRIFGYQNS